MHLLAPIINNVDEWEAVQRFDKVKPRLPFPYAFGGAFLDAGHTLSAIDLHSMAGKKQIAPFKSLYHKKELTSALERVDVAVLFGSDALKAIINQSLTSKTKNNILYYTYVFASKKASLKQKLQELAVRSLAGSAKGIVLMTAEQQRAAQELYDGSFPVIRLRVGIDTAFYREKSLFSDVTEFSLPAVEELLKEPYVIMPGDELRYNDDAIRFVEKSGIRLVRVSQYADKSGTEKLKQDVIARNLSDRLFVFEKISYPFLRFLLQHASAYAGLVDSSWQPAGWTVACEALSSGLPVMLYDGLVSREMNETGVSPRLVQSVAMGDISAFTEKLASLVASGDRASLSMQASEFAASQLDFTNTAPPFVSEVEKLVAA